MNSTIHTQETTNPAMIAARDQLVKIAVNRYMDSHRLSGRPDDVLAGAWRRHNELLDLAVEGYLAACEGKL